MVVCYVSFFFLIIIERNTEKDGFMYLLDITVVSLLKYLFILSPYVWQIHTYYTVYSIVSPFHRYKDESNNH